MEIPFRMQIGKPSAYDVTAYFTWKVTMNAGTCDRVISINYTFFANDNYLFWIREDFIGVFNGTFGGAYPPQTIRNSSTMKTGNNELKIKVNINSTSNKPSACYFKLEIYEPHINVTALDSDVDSILDAVDPLPTFNNYVAILTISVCGILSIFLAERCHHIINSQKTVNT